MYGSLFPNQKKNCDKTSQKYLNLQLWKEKSELQDVNLQLRVRKTNSEDK